MRLPRSAFALLAAAALLSGCGDDELPPESPATAPVTASPTPSAPSARATPAPSAGSTSYGSDGFTVRYLGPDGKLKSLAPEDLPR
jgi:hypothetical protein